MPHHRRSEPVRPQRASSQVVAIHNGMSNVCVASSDPVSSTRGDATDTAAVATCAHRPPPNSRAISAASTTPAKDATIAGAHRASGEPPLASAAHARNATSNP